MSKTLHKLIEQEYKRALVDSLGHPVVELLDERIKRIALATIEAVRIDINKDGECRDYTEDEGLTTDYEELQRKKIDAFLGKEQTNGKTSTH